MTRIRADLWALAGIVTDPLWRRTRWGWARRLEDRVYGRHLAARIERERSGTFTTANHSHATIDGRREWPR